jgi:hypothetical protein
MAPLLRRRGRATRYRESSRPDRKPEAPPDLSQQERTRGQAERLGAARAVPQGAGQPEPVERRERVAATGGGLLGAAFRFLGIKYRAARMARPLFCQKIHKTWRSAGPDFG